MACRLVAPSHYLTQCWNIVDWTPRSKLQWNFKRYWYIFFQENAFENVVWKMAAILSRPQCVKAVWGAVAVHGLCNTHIHVNNFQAKVDIREDIIGSDNGLSLERRQAIIWTNAGILFIGPLGTNFSDILIEIQTFSLKKIRLKMSSAKCCSFRLGLNVLIHCPFEYMDANFDNAISIFSTDWYLQIYLW